MRLYACFTIIMFSISHTSSLWFNKTTELEEVLHEDEEKAKGSSIDKQLQNTLLEASAKRLENGGSYGNAETSDEVLVEYDILITLQQYASIFRLKSSAPGARRFKRNSAVHKKWPNATVKYKIYPMLFSLKELKMLRIAMKQWEHFTCVKFKEAAEADEHFLQFRTGHSGCNSFVGFQNIGKQNINLQSPGCSHVNVYLHEIGHAIGLYHEHSRPDRDDYIWIDWKSVENGKENTGFRKLDDLGADTFGLQYEYSSIMHYGLTAYSKDGKQTMHARNKENEKLILKSGRELQFKDIQTVNFMYSCNAQCSTNIRCRDGGFVNKECTCFCKDGTNNCQESGQKPPGDGKECTNTISDDLCNAYLMKQACWQDAMSIVPKCKKSCGFCGLNLKGGSPHAKGNCKNPLGDYECAILASVWYCHLMAAYMVVNCPQACGWCDRKDNAAACENVWHTTDCDVFATFGYCRSERIWMLAHCRKSCKACDIVDKTCNNEHINEAECYAWALTGECYENARWMYKNCRRACGKCGNLPGAQCKNIIRPEQECERRVQQGHCSDIMHAHWMVRNCLKSCQQALKDSCAEGGCVDMSSRCQSWAKLGECYMNPRYMMQSCKMACSWNICPKWEKENHCYNKLSDEKCWTYVSLCGVGISTYTTRNCYRLCSGCGDNIAGGECVNQVSDDKCWSGKVLGHCDYIIGLCHRSCSGCGGDADKGKDCLDNSVVCKAKKLTGLCDYEPERMVKYCKKTCGFCDQSNFEEAVKISKTRLCKDDLESELANLERCKDFYNDGQCARNKWVRDHCKRTCGRCVECYDKKPDVYCNKIKHGGHCSTLDSKVDCEKSCGFCKPKGEPPIVSWHSCIDRAPDFYCKQWKRLCKTTMMMINCAKTCGICEDSNFTSSLSPKTSRKKTVTTLATSRNTILTTSTFPTKPSPTFPTTARIAVTAVKHTIADFCRTATNIKKSNKRDNPDYTCRVWAVNGHCRLNSVTRVCKKTCECDKCYDVDKTQCRQKAAEGSCTSRSSVLRKWMETRCAKTCQLCDGDTALTVTPKPSRKNTGTTSAASKTLTPTTTTSVAATAVKQTVADFCRTAINVKKSSQRDNPEYTCKVWATNGHCRLSSVTRVCKKTCECDKCYDVDENQCRQKAVKGSCSSGSAVLRKWMEKRCAKTCQLCSGDIESDRPSETPIRSSMQPHTITTSSLVVEGGVHKDCSRVTNLRQSNHPGDPDRDCKRWSAGGHCGNSYMEKNCVKTCTCETCFDVDEKDCHSKKTVGKCNPSTGYFKWMKKKCAKTCGECGEQSGGLNPENFPYGNAVNTLEKLVCDGEHCYVRKWNESCCDKSSGCAALVDVACSTSSMMRDKCPVSCGLCTQTCVDHFEWGSFDCQGHRQWCNDNRYAVLKAALEFCPLTCGYCNPCSEKARF